MTGGSVSDWVPSPVPVPGLAPRRKRAGRIVFWVLFALAGACAVGAGAGFTATDRVYTVPGAAMENTIGPGDRILVARGQDVRRGDLVVIDIPAGGAIASGSYVRRIIGLPGDHVACCNAAGDVTVNGKALHETQYLYPGNAPSRTRFSATLTAGSIWVMGDHRSISNDSRYWGVNIPESDIVGRVYMIAHGTTFTRVSTPATFIADGLAPSGGRVTWPLVCATICGAALLALILLSVFGIVRWSVRGRRQRRMYREAARSGPAA